MATRRRASATAFGTENARPTKAFAADSKEDGRPKKRAALGNISNRISQTRSTLQKASKPLKKMASATRRKRSSAQKKQQLRPEVPRMPILALGDDTMAVEAAALPPGVEDIDAADAGNPLMCPVYSNDIFANLLKMEPHYAVQPDYMESQESITPRTRSQLIDWLVEVHLRFDLVPETLFLTVGVLDRYLAEVQVGKDRLQLAGITAMFVAAKYEEMYPPTVADYEYIAQNAFSKDDILQMEQHCLYVLNFGLGQPLPLQFLRRFSKAANADGTMHTIAKFLMELTLISMQMLAYRPSEIAASALFLSREIMEKEEVWTPTIQHYTTYSAQDISSCIEALRILLVTCNETRFQAVVAKYGKTKFFHISKSARVRQYIEAHSDASQA